MCWAEGKAMEYIESYGIRKLFIPIVIGLEIKFATRRMVVPTCLRDPVLHRRTRLLSAFSLMLSDLELRRRVPLCISSLRRVFFQKDPAWAVKERNCFWSEQWSFKKDSAITY